MKLFIILVSKYLRIILKKTHMNFKFNKSNILRTLIQSHKKNYNH